MLLCVSYSNSNAQGTYEDSGMQIERVDSDHFLMLPEDR
jgi:hypothetical protein